LQAAQRVQVFEKNGRQEQADLEKAELAIIETYLPKAMGDDELAAIVDEVIAQLEAKDPKKMGPVVGAVMKRLAGLGVDGKRVNDLVRQRLGA